MRYLWIFIDIDIDISRYSFIDIYGCDLRPHVSVFFLKLGIWDWQKSETAMAHDTNYRCDMIMTFQVQHPKKNVHGYDILIPLTHRWDD